MPGKPIRPTQAEELEPASSIAESLGADGFGRRSVDRSPGRETGPHLKTDLTDRIRYIWKLTRCSDDLGLAGGTPEHGRRHGGRLSLRNGIRSGGRLRLRRGLRARLRLRLGRATRRLILIESINRTANHVSRPTLAIERRPAMWYRRGHGDAP